MINFLILIGLVSSIGFVPKESYEFKLRNDLFIANPKIQEMVDRVDTPETIYDMFSEEEILIFQKCVEAETFEAPLEAKLNVANVIYNRVLSEDYPDTFKEVVYQKIGNAYQFSCVLDGNIDKREISEDTIRACEMVFEQEDPTDGALFYLNKKHSSTKNVRWFDSKLEFLFTDSINHSIYR